VPEALVPKPIVSEAVCGAITNAPVPLPVIAALKVSLSVVMVRLRFAPIAKVPATVMPLVVPEFWIVTALTALLKVL